MGLELGLLNLARVPLSYSCPFPFTPGRCPPRTHLNFPVLSHPICQTTFYLSLRAQPHRAASLLRALGLGVCSCFSGWPHPTPSEWHLLAPLPLPRVPVSTVGTAEEQLLISAQHCHSYF